MALLRGWELVVRVAVSPTHPCSITPPYQECSLVLPRKATSLAVGKITAHRRLVFPFGRTQVAAPWHCPSTTRKGLQHHGRQLPQQYQHTAPQKQALDRALSIIYLPLFANFSNNGLCVYVRAYVRTYVCMHACMHACMYISYIVQLLSQIHYSYPQKLLHTIGYFQCSVEH